MPCLTKKIIYATAITAILNLSFQPAYAGKDENPTAEDITKNVSKKLNNRDAENYARAHVTSDRLNRYIPLVKNSDYSGSWLNTYGRCSVAAKGIAGTSAILSTILNSSDLGVKAQNSTSYNSQPLQITATIFSAIASISTALDGFWFDSRFKFYQKAPGELRDFITSEVKELADTYSITDKKDIKKLDEYLNREFM